jgi:exosortase K
MAEMRLILKQELSVRRGAQFLFVLLAAWALKRYYSTAGADDLWWILWSTARLTSLVTETRFYFEARAGYMSDDRSFLIAAACSGVNFLITAFLLLAMTKLWRHRRIEWIYLGFAAVAAYASTIVANTVRIALALWLNSAKPEVFGLGREELHRLDGILIYFGFLLLLYVLVQPRSKTAVLTNIGPVNCAVFGRVVGEGKRYFFPLAVYYATTLGIPGLNGALRRGGEFWEHAFFVAATPVVMIVMVAASGELARLYRERKRVSAAAAPLPGDFGTDEVRTGPDVRDAPARNGAVRLKECAVVFDGKL